MPVIKCVGKRDGSKKHGNYAQYLLEGGALVFVNLDNMTANYRGPETKTAKNHARKLAALEKRKADRAARKEARGSKKMKVVKYDPRLATLPSDPTRMVKPKK